MSEDVVIGREGNMGVVTLDRPRAINALTHEMIGEIYKSLSAWREDGDVSAVLFEGRGERGFCAGGDVRMTREIVLSGEIETALGFYADEYRNNLLIATYPKPIIALGHGIVMGGGIGLAGHAGIRIAVEGAKYAMPESAIGLFCDIGVNARLASVPAHRALLFSFAGLPVGPADAIALDLADAMVPADRLGDLRAALVAAAPGGRDALDELVAEFAVDAGEPVFCAVADRMASAFDKKTAGEMVEAIAALATPDDAALVATIRSRCPTSLEAILQTWRRAAADPDIGRVLERDLALARYLTVRGDFAEGVRSVLVDKDNAPNWSPASALDVDRDSIARVLSGPFD